MCNWSRKYHCKNYTYEYIIWNRGFLWKFPVLIYSWWASGRGWIPRDWQWATTKPTILRHVHVWLDQVGDNHIHVVVWWSLVKANQQSTYLYDCPVKKLPPLTGSQGLLSVLDVHLVDIVGLRRDLRQVKEQVKTLDQRRGQRGHRHGVYYACPARR